MAVSSPVLKTKLYRPPISDDSVLRTEILESLNSHLELPLTLVSAPAGYGKSYTISQWIEHLQAKHAWISLDKEHNSLRRFLQYLVESIRLSYPNILSTMYDYLQGVDLPPVNVLAYELINRLDEIQDEFIIVLDDFYSINETDIHQLLNILLSYPPQNVQLVIISRMDPPLNINQLRAYGRINEIRVGQLQFTESDIGSLYGKLTNTELNPETIKHLLEQTEGWVVGLRMAHLYAYNTKDVNKVLMDLSGDYRLISKFLLEEVLSKQPDSIREMLFFSAIPDSFCAELIEAIYLPTSKDKMRGEEFIQHIYKNNLFIIPLDQEQKWFRYHHLFRELLLGELNKSIQDEQIRETHIRVSGWMEDEGFIGNAMNYAINGDQINRAANILLKNRYDWMEKQKWWGLEELLAKIPENFINQSAELLLLKAWIEGANKFKMDQIFPITQLAVEAFNQYQDGLSDEEVQIFHGEVATLRAMPFFWMGKGALCHEQAVIAIKNTPEEHLAVYGQAMEYYAGSFHLMGDSEKGANIIRTILDKNDSSVKDHLHRFYITLITIEILNGNINAYKKYALEFLKHAEKNKIQESIGWAYYVLGNAHYLQSNLEEARVWFQKLIDHRYLSNVGSVAHAYAGMAITMYGLGEIEKAKKYAEDGLLWAKEVNNTGILFEAQSCISLIELMQGNILENDSWSSQLGEDIPLMLLLNVPHITLAKRFIVEKKLPEAAALLVRLKQAANATHNTWRLIEVLALESVVNEKLEDYKVSENLMIEAIELASPRDLMQPFVELGDSCIDIFRRIQKRQEIDFIDKILATSERQRSNYIEDSQKKNVLASISSKPVEKDALSFRELDVLKYVAEGYRNKEIAQKLFISEVTIKKHMYNIFKKMDVNNRINMVQKAQELGLLEEFHRGAV